MDRPRRRSYPRASAPPSTLPVIEQSPSREPREDRAAQESDRTAGKGQGSGDLDGRRPHVQVQAPARKASTGRLAEPDQARSSPALEPPIIDQAGAPQLRTIRSKSSLCLITTTTTTYLRPTSLLPSAVGSTGGTSTPEATITAVINPTSTRTTLLGPPVTPRKPKVQVREPATPSRHKTPTRKTIPSKSSKTSLLASSPSKSLAHKRSGTSLHRADASITNVRDIRSTEASLAKKKSVISSPIAVVKGARVDLRTIERGSITAKMADDYGYLYATGDELDVPPQPQALSPMRLQSGRGTHRRSGSTETSATAKGPSVCEAPAPPAKSPRPKATPQKPSSNRPELKTVFPNQINSGGNNHQGSSSRAYSKPTTHSHGLRQAPPEPEAYSQSSRGAANDKNSRWYDSERENAPRLATATATSTTASEAGTIKGPPEMPLSVADVTRGMHGETLSTLYLVSGLTKDPKTWSIADPDAIKGVTPLEDSLGCFWRPEVLGKTFSGKSNDRPPKSSVSTFGGGMQDPRQVRHSHKSGAAVQEETAVMSKMIAKALKLSHPREVEIVNATLAPPSMTHMFTFELPQVDGSGTERAGTYATMPSRGGPTTRLGPEAYTGASRGSKQSVTWYGVCLTVWNHADVDRAKRLKAFKQKLRATAVLGGGPMTYSMDALNLLGASTTTLEVTGQGGNNRLQPGRPLPPGRGNQAWRAMSGVSDYVSASEDGHASESDVDRFGVRRRRTGPVGNSQLRASTIATEVNDDADAVFQEGEDLFWIPYALTLVSRYPVYDCMSDYLKLSWARFSKNVKAHSLQISRILNYPAPRPGDAIRLPSGQSGGEVLELSCVMPGALVFQRGVIQNFQIWPLFQVLNVDNVLNCLEVALSPFGRVIFISRYPGMLGVAVETVKYIVSLRGWDGISLPLLHGRDMSVLIEDPGPYLIGINSESRNCVTPPPDALVVDLDANSATFAGRLDPEGVLSYRATREKYKKRLLASYGPTYNPDHNVPGSLKFSYPGGKLRPSCTIEMGPWQPAFLGEVIRCPSWFDAASVVTTVEKILVDKTKKPGFMARLVSSTPKKATPSAGEVIANQALRTRALHYIETRDSLESKFGHLQRRLLRMVQEGEMWKKRFEQFEKYADQLGVEAEQLKAKIEQERREAKRLSGVLTEEKQKKNSLQQKLAQTEDAHKEAMKQLSDMNQSIQEIERERDAMMAAIESQLEGVFSSGMADDNSDTSSRAGSPISVKSGSVLGGRRRSATLETQKSTATIGATYAKHKKTVIDAAAERRSSKRFSAQTNGTTIDDAINFKSKEMADRMSTIQQKLEMALQNVSVHRRASLATSTHSGGSESGEQASADSAASSVDDNQGDVSSVRDDDSVVDVVERGKAPRNSGGEVYTSTTQVELPMPHQGTEDDDDQLSPLGSAHTVRRTPSQTVLATITTVVKVNDERDRTGHGVRSRSSSRASATTHAEHHNSRVSLVPVVDERFKSDLDVIVAPTKGSSIQSADGVIGATGKHGRNGVSTSGIKHNKKPEHRHERGASLDAN